MIGKTVWWVNTTKMRHFTKEEDAKQHVINIIRNYDYEYADILYPQTSWQKIIRGYHLCTQDTIQYGSFEIYIDKTEAQIVEKDL